MSVLLVILSACGGGATTPTITPPGIDSDPAAASLANRDIDEQH